MNNQTHNTPTLDLDGLRQAAEAALKIVPGELVHETEDRHSSETCHNALLNDAGQRVADSLNAEVGAFMIEEDEDGGGWYIDIGTYDLFKFWEKTTPRTLLALLHRLEAAERERLPVVGEHGLLQQRDAAQQRERALREAVDNLAHQYETDAERSRVYAERIINKVGGFERADYGEYEAERAATENYTSVAVALRGLLVALAATDGGGEGE